MIKLTKAGIAIALGLTFSLSMFTGAFAQSAKQSAANGVVVAAVTTSSLQRADQGHDNWWQGKHWNGSRWHGNRWQHNRWHGLRWHDNHWQDNRWHGSQWHDNHGHDTQWQNTHH